MNSESLADTDPAVTIAIDITVDISSNIETNSELDAVVRSAVP